MLCSCYAFPSTTMCWNISVKYSGSSSGTRLKKLPEMDAIVETQELTDVFNGNVMATDHVSFRVEGGKVFGFLGSNGAGKTTGIRVLTTLFKHARGAAAVEGLDVVTEVVRGLIGYPTGTDV